MGKIQIKSSSDIELMKEGGGKLRKIKKALEEKIASGVSAEDVEKLACRLIKEENGQASFKTVPGYTWATCVNVNEGVVHGIPKKEVVFRRGDIVSIDIGFLYKGFHTDSSLSLLIGSDNKKKNFLESGKKALTAAIKNTRKGKTVYDISKSIESVLEKDGLNPVRSLVGHGVGKDLHEDPQIPCFTHGDRVDSPKIETGMAFAIEVMYTQGDSDLVLEPDGWTISTRDGKIAGLFEETVIVTKNGPLVIT